MQEIYKLSLLTKFTFNFFTSKNKLKGEARANV